ncbi:hypothetical protein L208DRAFT_1393255, partial [Tricholoma matsutake]
SCPTTPTRRIPQFVTPIPIDDEVYFLPDVTDAEDSDYSPRAEQRMKRALAEKITPLKRRKTASSVATYARKNAIDAFRLATGFISPASRPIALAHYHEEIPCLTSRKQQIVDCVETCHLIPKAVDYDTLDKLEWVWGLEFFTLNVDTRFNLVHHMSALLGYFY